MKLLEHFKELTVHPKNAEELKGLILQLAIQGKLTKKWRKENIGVKPASLLLEKIATEKRLLVKEKKIKKENTLAEIDKDEIPFDLPESWAWCYLNDLGVIASSSRVHMKDWTTEGVPFYRAREIVKLSKFNEVDNDLFITRELFEHHKKNGIAPENNDIMLTGVGTIGIPYVVKQQDEFYFKDASVLIFKNLFDLNTEYLNLFFKTPFWIKEIHKESMGTTVHTLTISRAKLILTVFPPLEEQKAIVSIVNTLFKEVEELEKQTKARIQLKEDFVTSALNQFANGETATEWAYLQPHFHSFFTEKSSIKKLRESILQLAVQGKLTRAFRETHPELCQGSNSASALLERIKVEKAQLIKSGKIKKEKPLPPIPEDETPYQLPEGWVWCRLGDISEKLGAGSTPTGGKSAYVEEGFMFFRSQNIHNYYLKLQQVAYITEATHKKMSSSEVKAKDLLLNITGGSIGRCALVPDDFDTANVSQHVAIVRLVELKLRKYMHSLIISKQFQDTIMDVQVGVSREGLSMTKLKLFLVPLPPLSEQKAIVEKVNGLMALCDRLEKEIELNTQQLEDLMQSCLREVFNDNKS